MKKKKEDEEKNSKWAKEVDNFDMLLAQYMSLVGIDVLILPTFAQGCIFIIDTTLKLVRHINRR